ncbi:aldehyde dehydrogenase family protein [Ruegeria sp. 2012CJ41-6]|uniref:Aldehyde dehydrogenase family protein n=1 Tax=Ruegeria spongiae TaxID=2942209 RepID=A0ABT0Q9I7_9RHOB|nr:aldehyde dehydrogenase family protein [Ruegeria spongiae]MCL6285838.1 aldehyde dehydrogenase family protein [Ruegeria spongiae]
MTAKKKPAQKKAFAEYDGALKTLDQAKQKWVQTGIQERLTILQDIKDALKSVADDWVAAAVRHKGIPEGSSLEGEEWFGGPYSMMTSCSGFMQTLSQMQDKAYLDNLHMREVATGQTAVRVLPHSTWDHLLMSGVKAEIWMQPGVTADNLKQHVAKIYDIPVDQRVGKVALILGAGNVASIAPLDCFQKLFVEDQVTLLKMNPVNDYLAEFLEVSLKPLIDRDVLRIVKGDGAVGAYLTDHPLVEEIHVTGAAATHDAIVWGPGEEGVRNKAKNTPKNTRHVTSELGGVCPTIVVPGPWSRADIKFQAENIATQKLNNSGFNCVAFQALILPRGWNKTDALMDQIRKFIGNSRREAYYPGAKVRLDEFARHSKNAERIERDGTLDFVITNLEDDKDGYYRTTEVFGPAFSTLELDAPDPETYLRAAIAYANDQLEGTLGANIIIHPTTIWKIGKITFEKIIAELRYGAIAINTWTGLAYMTAQCPWGAFPGHTKQDIQSGIGTVHNTMMLEQTERSVVQAPWSPFPNNLLFAGDLSLMPKPPWLVGSKNQAVMGRLLTDFYHQPNWFKLQAIMMNAVAA